MYNVKKKWEFIYDIKIVMSPPVHHLCQNIIGNFLGWYVWYQFWFSNKDNPIEILIFLITSWKFQDCVYRGGEQVETVWNYIIKVLLSNCPVQFVYNCRITQSTLQYTNSWREKRRVHAFPRRICMRRNANIFVQNLNASTYQFPRKIIVMP